MLHESWALSSTLLTRLAEVSIVWRKVLQHRDNACMHLNQTDWAIIGFGVICWCDNSKIELVSSARAVLMKLSSPFKFAVIYTLRLYLVKRYFKCWHYSLTDKYSECINSKQKIAVHVAAIHQFPLCTSRTTHATSPGRRPLLTNLRALVSVSRRRTRWDRYLPFLCCFQPGISCSGTPDWAGTCLLLWS